MNRRQSSQQSGGGSISSTNFVDVFGKGNAKCTVTDGNTEITWWLKNQDYKVIATEIGAQQVTVIKKGDEIYLVDQTGKCIFYNIKEFEQLAQNQQQQQSPAQEIESTVEAYQGYIFSCVPRVVTDADIAKPSGTCEDLTEVLRQTMQQACGMCQQNPEVFGDDCSQYCIS